MLLNANDRASSTEIIGFQIFVKSRSDRGFTASVLEMPSIAANGNTEGEAIAQGERTKMGYVAIDKN